MGRRPPVVRRAGTAALCAAALWSREAVAAPADAAALKLRDEAVYTDYLATNFADAAAKLEEAIRLCNEPTECSPAVRARLLCDLGVIDFALQKRDEGRAQFAAALEEDPELALDPDLSSTDLQREFAVAKAGGSAQGLVARVEEDHPPESASPQAAAAAADCPPAFPGCRSSSRSTACVSDDECPAGQACADGACADTGSTARTPREPYKRNWLSVAFQADALLLPSASDVCAGGTGYTCFGNDGSYYAGTPLAGADDQVNGGVTLATSRILLGYDRAIGENATLGARLGYSLGGGPQRPTANGFMPVHVEARATYWFGDDPLARSGFRFFVLAATGTAQVDASIPVDVYANTQAYQNQRSQGYRAWKKTGLGFGAAGGGGMFAITPSTGFALEAKAMEMFPTAATGFSLQLAYLVGM